MVLLPDEEPELVARMILWTYFETYPLSPDRELYAGVSSVSTALQNNIIDVWKPREAATEPAFDAVLHLRMYILAEKLFMPALKDYASDSCVWALKFEPEGFLPCIEMLRDAPENVKEEMENDLAAFVVYNGIPGGAQHWIEKVDTVSPDMAALLTNKVAQKEASRQRYY